MRGTNFTVMKRAFFMFNFLLLLSGLLVAAQDSVKVLIVTAHPDDESGFAATIYKITHELNGVADLAVITNGEAGYKYSLLAEPFYNLKLTVEDTGRKYLPSIRKKELKAAGNILGIRNYFFFDQKDNHYTLDVDTVLTQVWDTATVLNKLKNIIQVGSYDIIFCLLPVPGTHGHHKGATILALQALSDLEEKKTVILGATTSSVGDTLGIRFSGLENFPLTRVKSGAPSFTIDRNIKFGFKNQLSYKIIVNWEIAEHKSQGSMQTYMNQGDYENFWYFDMNSAENTGKVKNIFLRLNEYKY